jgi:hypothetical protein
MKLIEEEAGLEGKILRPLSAKVLPTTTMEKTGDVNRAKLVGIRGRSRKKQIELAKKFAITDYPCPAGGCLLTYKEFANKLRDIFNHKKQVSLHDVVLLKLGRHFRFGKNKIVIGRHDAENKTLLKTRKQGDYYFEVPDCGSPTTILQGPKTKEAIKKAAVLTAYYSDNKDAKVLVKFGRENLDKSISVFMPDEEAVEELRIS